MLKEQDYADIESKVKSNIHDAYKDKEIDTGEIIANVALKVCLEVLREYDKTNRPT